MEVILEIGKTISSDLISKSQEAIYVIPYIFLSMLIPMWLIFVYDREEDGSGFGFFGWFTFKIFRGIGIWMK